MGKIIAVGMYNGFIVKAEVIIEDNHPIIKIDGKFDEKV